MSKRTPPWLLDAALTAAHALWRNRWNILGGVLLASLCAFALIGMYSTLFVLGVAR